LGTLFKIDVYGGLGSRLRSTELKIPHNFISSEDPEDPDDPPHVVFTVAELKRVFPEEV